MEVGSVYYTVDISTADFERKIKKLESQYRDLSFTITPKVDHKPLTELNEHIDKKIKHIKELQGVARKGVTVRSSYSQERSNQASKTTANFTIDPEILKVLQQIEKNTRGKGVAGRAISGLFSGAKSVVSGFTEGVGTNISKNFSDGVLEVLEDRLGQRFGSSRAIGASLTSKYVDRIVSQFSGLTEFIDKELEKELSKPTKQQNQKKVLILQKTQEMAKGIDTATSGLVDQKTREEARFSQKGKQSKAQDKQKALIEQGVKSEDFKTQRINRIVTAISKIDQEFADLIGTVKKKSATFAKQIADLDVKIQETENQLRQATDEVEITKLEGIISQSLQQLDALSQKASELSRQTAKINSLKLGKLQGVYAEYGVSAQEISKIDKLAQSKAGIEKASREVKQLSEFIAKLTEGRERIAEKANELLVAGDMDKYLELSNILEETDRQIDQARKYRGQVTATGDELAKPIKALQQYQKRLDQMVIEIIKRNKPLSNAEKNYQTVARKAVEASGLDYESVKDYIPKLGMTDDPRAMGAYSKAQNTIYLNQGDLARLNTGQLTEEMIDTLIHEVRHAVQQVFGKLTRKEAAEIRGVIPRLQEVDVLSSQQAKKVISGIKGSAQYAVSESEKRGKPLSEDQLNEIIKLEQDAYTFAAKETERIAKEMGVKVSAKMPEMRIPFVTPKTPELAVVPQQQKQTAQKAEQMKSAPIKAIESANTAQEEALKQIIFIGDQFHKIGQKIKSLSGEELKQYVQLVTETVDQAYARVEELSRGLPKDLARKAGARKGQITKTKNLVDSIKNEGRSIGNDLSEGMADGIEPSMAAKAAKSMADAAIESTKDALEIQSPSKVFERIGKFITEGLVKGIKEGSSKLKNAIDLRLLNLNLEANASAIDNSLSRLENKVETEILGSVQRRGVDAEKTLASVQRKLLELNAIDAQFIDEFQGLNYGRGRRRREITAPFRQMEREGVAQAASPSQEELSRLEDAVYGQSIKYADLLEATVELVTELGVGAVNPKELKALQQRIKSKEKQLDTALDYADQVMMAEDMGLKRTEAIGMTDNFQSGIGEFFQQLKNNNPVVAKSVELFRNLTLAVIGIGVVDNLADALRNFARASTQSALTMERLKVSLNFSTTRDVAQTLGKIREESDRLGLSFLTSAKNYQQLSAATLGTPLQFQTDTIFSGIQSGLASRGASREQADRALLAITQIASKGRVSLEEINQQLGEALPGASQVAARALGVTTQEFIALVESGSLLAEELLPKLANQLKLESVGSLSIIDNSAFAQVARFENQIESLQIIAGQTILDAAKLGLPAVNKALSLLTDNAEMAGKLMLSLGTVALTVVATTALTVARSLGLATLATQALGIAGKTTSQIMIGLGKSLLVGLGWTAAVYAVIEVFSELFKVINAGSEESKRSLKDIENSLRAIQNIRKVEPTKETPIFQYNRAASIENARNQIQNAATLKKGAESARVAQEVNVLIKPFYNTATVTEFNKEIDKIRNLIGGVKVDIAIATEQKDTKKLEYLRQLLNSLQQQEINTINEAFPDVAQIQKTIDALKTQREEQEKILSSPNAKRTGQAVQAQQTIVNIDKELQKLLATQKQYNDAIADSKNQYLALSAAISRLSANTANLLSKTQSGITRATNAAKAQQAESLRQLGNSPNQYEFDSINRRTQQQVGQESLVRLRVQLDGLDDARNQLKTSLPQAGDEVDKQLGKIFGEGSFRTALESSSLTLEKLDKILGQGSGNGNQTFQELIETTPRLKSAVDAAREYLGTQKSIGDSHGQINDLLIEQANLERESALAARQRAQDLQDFANQQRDYLFAVEDYRIQQRDNQISLQQARLSLQQQTEDYASAIDDYTRQFNENAIQASREVRSFSEQYRDLVISLQQNFDQITTEIKNVEAEATSLRIRLRNKGLSQDNFARGLNDLIANIGDELRQVEADRESLAQSETEATQQYLQTLGQVRDLQEALSDSQRAREEQARATGKSLRDLDRQRIALGQSVLQLQLQEESIKREQIRSGVALTNQFMQLARRAEELGVAMSNAAAATSTPSESSPFSPSAANSGASSKQQALIRAANKIGLKPVELAAIISWESGFNPNRVGGEKNLYRGLIQFGPAERRAHGVYPGQSFEEQVEKSVVSYFKERGFKPGMGLLKAYTTVLAGNPRANIHARDKFGTSAFSAFQNQIAPGKPHYRSAERFLSGAVVPQTSRVLGRSTTAQNPQSAPMASAPIKPIPVPVMPPLPKLKPVNLPPAPELPALPQLDFEGVRQQTESIKTAKDRLQAEKEIVNALKQQETLQTQEQTLAQFGVERLKIATDTAKSVRDQVNAAADFANESKGYLTIEEEAYKIGRDITNDYQDKIDSLKEQRLLIEQQTEQGVEQLEMQRKNLEILGLSKEVIDKTLADQQQSVLLLREQLGIIDQGLNKLKQSQGRAVNQGIKDFRERDRLDAEKEIADIAADRLELEAGITENIFEQIRLRQEAAKLRSDADYSGRVQDLERLRDRGSISSDQYAESFGYLQKMQDIDLKQAFVEANPFAQALGDTLENVLDSASQGFENFGQVASNALKQIAAMLFKMAINALIFRIFSGIAGGASAGGSVGTALNSGAAVGNFNFGIAKQGGTITNDGVRNYFNGGRVGGNAPTGIMALGLGVAQAMKREGGNAVPLVGHRGEEVLTTRNGDAEYFRLLKRSGQWEKMKKSTPKANFSVENKNFGGSVGGVKAGSLRTHNSNGQTVIYQTNKHIYYTPDADSFRKSQRQRDREEQTRKNRNTPF